MRGGWLPLPAMRWHSPAAMERSFNTTGPCYPDEHYMLPPERRLGRVMELIERGKYFTLHAGRQTGKTTSAEWLTGHYNAGDRFRAVWFDLQTARDKPDPAAALRVVLDMLDMGGSTWWAADGAIPPLHSSSARQTRQAVTPRPRRRARA